MFSFRMTVSVTCRTEMKALFPLYLILQLKEVVGKLILVLTLSETLLCPHPYLRCMFILNNIYHVLTNESLSGKEGEVDDYTQMLGAKPTSLCFSA